MQFWMYILLFLSVIVSGSSVLFINISSKNLKLILSYSGAFPFSISLLPLLPSLSLSGTPTVVSFILIGLFAQILLEFFTEGIEHGHIHVHKHDHKHSAFPYAMMIGLSIHSFLEGMPLANASADSHNSLLTGIVMHNIPIAIALMTMLLASHISKNTAVFWLIVFALVTPLGTFTSYAIEQNLLFDLSLYTDKIMAVVIGIFLHISTTILFESSENHRFNLIKFIMILLGAGTAIAMM
ncbi:ZIP family metal transporter [soil metagenome]